MNTLSIIYSIIIGNIGDMMRGDVRFKTMETELTQ